MAQRVNVVLVDDLDGSAATQTVTFALDGVHYEIDLGDRNADKLRSEIGKWTENARRVGGRRTPAKKAASGKAASGTEEIRAWARDNGYTVRDRGRVSAEVRAAYEAAH